LIYIGSSAGLQYNEKSDIDIQVMMKIPPGREGSNELLEYHKLVKFHNNSMDYLTNTDHPINYFVLPEFEMNYSDEAWSIYLIVNFDTGEEDIWLRPYRKLEDIKDISAIAGNELQYASMYASMLRNRVNELSKDVKDLKSLSGEDIKAKLREVDSDIEDLIYQYSRVDRGRKLQYSSGWGIPKLSPANLLYKFLERENLLYFLEKLKDQINY
jgi:hypothetical protein